MKIPFLRKGDRVALAAPARKVSPEEMAPAIAEMERWGLEVVVPEGLYEAEGQLAGSDSHRAALLQGLLDDPEIRAIVCCRGGYGTVRIEGLFTGHVSQQASLWMLTLPVYATYTLTPKWQLKAGPYVSLMLSKDFSGTASDGYLRQGGPTGPRIDIGDTPDTWATYDFSDEVRRLQLGLTLGADWQALPRLGFSLDLSMGFTGLFPADFSTVEQTLYPLYGTLGVCYEL